MEINNVIICGLGALGQTYAKKLQKKCNLKILADNNRIKKYKQNPPCFNDEILELDYITPDDDFKTDLIIISTKANALEEVISDIKNFVSKKTLILSLINGISSEEIISKTYDNVIKSFFIGGSAIRNDNKVFQDGKGKLIIEQNKYLEKFFKKCSIQYEISSNIVYSQWVKLAVNIILNEPSAIYGLTIGELRKKEGYFDLAKSLILEIKDVATACGIKYLNNFEKDVFDSANLVSPNGQTSMLQDVIAKRKTEIDIFSGEIIKLAKNFEIKTPWNEKMYNKIKKIERGY